MLAHVSAWASWLLWWWSNARYNEGAVSTIQTPRLQKPKADAHLKSAGERVKAAAADLVRRGIASPTGKRVRKDTPKDMRENADREFGG